MNVNRTSRIAVAGLFLALMSPLSSAQGNRTSYDPLTQQRSSKQKDGFVDSSLKRINPCDTDYGQHLDDGRSMVLQKTLESAYFWSNIVSLGLLGACSSSLFIRTESNAAGSGARRKCSRNTSIPCHSRMDKSMRPRREITPSWRP